MKNAMMFRICFIIPLIIFIDYVVMILIGSVAHVVGCGYGFYCGAFCILGKVLLGLSVILILFPEIKEFVLKGKSSFKIKR